MSRVGGRRWRIAAWAAGIVMGLPLILVALVTLALHEDASATWLTRQVLARVDVWPEADVTVGYVDLAGFWHLTVRDLRVGPSGAGRPPMVVADELEGRFSILPLLGGRLAVEQVRATGVAVAMRQRPDSTWDLLAPFTDTTGAAAPRDTAAGSWLLEVGSAALEGAFVQAEFLAATDSTATDAAAADAPATAPAAPDSATTTSILRVEGLTLRARDIRRAAEELAITLDTLDARILPPARPGSPAHLSAAMQLEDGALRMDVRLLSDSSDVTARGTLRLPNGTVADFREADFRVAALPLDFRDVGAFLPGMDVPGSVRLEAVVRGSADLVEIEVDGRSFDGATIHVSGSATPRTTGSLRYVLEGRVRDLVPALWMEGQPAVDDVDADVSLDLGGPALDALSGTASLDASAATLGTGSLDPTRAELVFERGTVTFDVRGSASPWASVVASGTARPFDSLPSYDLSAMLDQLEPVGGDGTRVASGSVSLELEGRGLDPNRAEGRATLTIDGRLGDAEVRAGTVEARWSDASGRAELDVPIGDGRVAGSLDGSWGGDAARIDLSAFDVTRLDVTALLGDSVSGILSMNGTGEVVWGDNGARAGQIEAVLEGARWRSAVLDTGRVRAELREGDLTAEAVLVSPAGDVELDASARPFDDVRTWRIDRLVTDSFDLSLAAEGLPSSAITGTLSMEGTLPHDPRRMTATGSFALAPSMVGPERIDTAEVRMTYAGGRLDVDGEAGAIGGSLVLSAEARPLEDVPTFRLERLAFDGIRPDSAWAGPAPLELSGVLTAEGAVPPGGLPEVSAVLELEPSLVNGGRIEGGRATLTLADARAVVEAQLRTPGGGLDLDGEAGIVRDEAGIRIVSLVANGGVELPGLHAFLQREAPAALHGRFGVSGGRTEAGALEWSGVVTASGALGEARLDALEVSGGITDGILRLDTLHLASNVMRGSGGGAIALDDSVTSRPDGLTVRLVVDSIDALAAETPVRPLSLRSASFELRATHPGAGIRLEALFGMGGAIAGGFGADTISGVATARVEGRTLTGGTARLRGTSLGVSAATFESVQADVAYDSAYGAQFAIGARRDEAHEVHVAGTAHPEDANLELDSLRVSLPQEQWMLARPTTIRWGDRFDAGGLALEATPGRIALDGSLDPDGMQDLTLTLEAVRLDGFADLLGIEGLQGSVGGRLALAGPADDVTLSGMVDATVQGVRTNVTVEPSETGHAVGALLRDGRGGRLEVGGYVPLEISLAGGDSITAEPAPVGEAALDVTATAFAIDWLAPFLSPLGVEQLGGLFHADARVEGRLEEPRLSGTARIVEGVVRIPEQGVVYQAIGGTFELMGDRIGVRELRMTSGGTAVIEGTVILDPFPDPGLDLVATFDQFRAAQNEWTRLGMSGELTVGGSLSEPRIGGAVRLADTDIYADPMGEGGNGAPVLLTEEDYAMLESYFGYRPSEAAAFEEDPILGWAVDVVVELERDVWLRKSAQPELRLELGGSLDVTKAAGDSIQLFGTIEVLPERSYFEELGRRFDVTEGTVTFNGSIWGWEADVVAQYEVASFRDPSAPEVTITLEVTGGLEDLEVIMGSNPTMETADILSYIATGRPAESAVAFGGAGQGGGGDGVVGLGASLALDRVAGALEDVAAEGAGLDVVEIRQQPQGLTVVAGRYVSPRLFVGVRQPLTNGSGSDNALGRTARGTEVELEYSWTSWLLMSLQGGESTVSFFLRTKHAF